MAHNLELENRMSDYVKYDNEKNLSFSIASRFFQIIYRDMSIKTILIIVQKAMVNFFWPEQYILHFISNISAGRSHDQFYESIELHISDLTHDITKEQKPIEQKWTNFKPASDLLCLKLDRYGSKYVDPRSVSDK